jgi:predicted O-methyltransferase YrrM
VDSERFLRELRERFDDFPSSPRPRDARFEELLDAVPGLACPNNLALVNCAAACVEPGESYIEAGTYRGTSLIAALLGNDVDAVGIDDFRMGDGSREQLDANLAHFGVSATIVESDVFTALEGDALGDRRAGVYYYDAGHDYEEQIRGLELAERHLAPGALVIVDDTDWERVERAMDDYLASQPRATRILTIGGKDRGSPAWWEGMQVLVWDATG